MGATATIRNTGGARNSPTRTGETRPAGSLSRGSRDRRPAQTSHPLRYSRVRYWFTVGTFVTFDATPSYRIFFPWPARSATMPSSIVSVSPAAYSNGELAAPCPLHAATQLNSCDTSIRGSVLGTAFVF